jgi:hypothetical protein
VSSKPLVNALATAAAPDLRAWVRSNAEEVEGVVDAALAVPENVALAEEVDFSAPTPLSFGEVADLAEDGLTDEQRKRALAWLKKRADRSEGEFDAEVAHDAITLLPGWSSEIVTTRRAVPMNGTTANGSFPAAMIEAGIPHTPVRAGWSPRWDNFLVVQKGGGWDEDRMIAEREIAETFRAFDAKKTKVKDLPAGRWAASIEWRDDGTAMIVKPVLVFAEQGGLRVTNAQGDTATVTGGKSAWKAFYGERDSNWKYTGGLGMREAAKSVVDALARKVEAREAFVKASKGGWGGALCPVCFQRAAVTPTSRHMVDHRHQRPGWGYNVSPCEGNRYAPYKESPAGTQFTLRGLHGMFDGYVTSLRDMLAHPEKQAYRVKVYLKDEQGRPIYDKVPVKDWRGRDTTKQVQRQTEIVVRQGHPLFRDLYEKDEKARRAQIHATADAIPFYAAAVRVWQEGLDDASPILAATRKTDAPALPRDLFPEG